LTKRKADWPKATINQNFDQRQNENWKDKTKFENPTIWNPEPKWNKKKNLPKPPLKKDFRQLDELQLLQNLICVCSWFCISAKHLTVCVTRAGAGGGTPSDWENAEA
jgi:hypothetical protein